MPKGIYKRSENQLKKLKALSLKPRSLRNGGYHAIHKWLYSRYGKADKCDNPFCENKSKKFQWAKKKECEYKHNRENFLKLCCKCHRKYDDTPERGIKIGNSQRGIKHSQSHKNKISKSCKGIHKGNKHSAKKIIQLSINGEVIKIWDCMNDAALNLNISPSGISMCARGIIKKSGGFKWNYLNNV